MRGKLYGIGLGPGDPELVTLKARRVLEKVEVVAFPRAERGEGSIAFSILQQVLTRQPEFLELNFPMTRNKEMLRHYWQQAANKVIAKLKEGLNVAFITLGDPLLYSTYSYLLKAIKDTDSDIAVETIPGVISFSAAAALSNLSLVESDETLAIVPASDNLEALRAALTQFDTVVVMKIGARLSQVQELLKQLGLIENSVLVSRAGLDGEFVTKGLSTLNKEAGYLSTIIVKKPRGRKG